MVTYRLGFARKCERASEHAHPAGSCEGHVLTPASARRLFTVKPRRLPHGFERPLAAPARKVRRSTDEQVVEVPLCLTSRPAGVSESLTQLQVDCRQTLLLFGGMIQLVSRRRCSSRCIQKPARLERRHPAARRSLSVAKRCGNGGSGHWCGHRTSQTGEVQTSRH